ncbi:MAG: TetR family transcriptional regulator [Rhizobiales bacterium]|nr:TetR family transcriptional regulator [Hyphomicrobiales bacterium]
MAVHALQSPGSSESDARRVETSERILDEAERLFRHYGFGKTTVADIARELGMSPANVYRFFPSKSAIHEAIATRMLAMQEVALQRISELPIPAAEKLRRFVVDRYHSTLALMIDETKVHEMVTAALDEHWSVIDRHLQRVTEILTHIMEQGIAAGEFAAQDPEAAARGFKVAVVSAIHPSIMAQCRKDPDFPTPEEVADFAIRALKV